MKPGHCIVIGGPTASGKTSLAIALAEKYNTVILSADSRQCFRELSIGVAKPTEEELSRVKHYFINTHSVHDPVTAADYERYALSVAEEVFTTNEILVVCGGTGLYLKAFLEGLDAIPEPEPEIRTEVRSLYEAEGLSAVQAALEKEDPLYFSSGETKNPQRAMRALEVIRSTGISILSYRTEKPARPFTYANYMIELPREELYTRINTRTDQMRDAGLTEEVRSLIPVKELNALHTVGYAELFDHFDGITKEDKAYDLIAQHSRNYAKRQLTWFSKENFQPLPLVDLLKI